MPRTPPHASAACPCPTFLPTNCPFSFQQQDVRLCLISTQPDQLPPGLLLLALLASLRVLHLDSHLAKTNKANPNPTITQHPGGGGGRGGEGSLGAASPLPSRVPGPARPQPLTPPGAPPAPALPASFCVELESPPPRPLAPPLPQPAHPLPCAPHPAGPLPA